jgi:hypothetical protein
MTRSSTEERSSDVPQEKPITFGEKVAKQGPGRPRKSDALVSAHKIATVLQENGEKRGRDRPPKSKELAVPQDSNGLAGNTAKMGRGRPPKGNGLASLSKARVSADNSIVKRGRGRPWKIQKLDDADDENQGNSGNTMDTSLDGMGANLAL